MPTENPAATADREFTHAVDLLGKQGISTEAPIKTALIEVLGELPAMVALSYTGEPTRGNLSSFQTRMQELFGTSYPTILSGIAVVVQRQFDKQPVGVSGRGIELRSSRSA